MDYTKQPIALSEQIKKLKNRGLIIDDEPTAMNYLTNISYYRLRAYTYPFQDNTNIAADHKFLRKDIHFSDIIDLYRFDRRLRLILFNAIEKIEVAIRDRISTAFSTATGDSHWFMDKSYFDQSITLKNGIKITEFDQLQADIKKDILRSHEDFIKHYNKKYANPELPPSWMTLEVLSFGTLSRLYKDLNGSPIKTKIATDLGLPKDWILSNWLYTISVWRNYCAHHSRIWNRRSIANIVLPYNTSFTFMDKQTTKTIRSNKIYAVLCCIKYISNIISPKSEIKNQLLKAIRKGGKLLNLKDMGFTENWEQEPLWNSEIGD